MFKTKAGWALNQDAFSESNLISFVDKTVQVGFNKEGGLTELRKLPYIKDLRPPPSTKRKKHKRRSATSNPRPRPPPALSPSAPPTKTWRPFIVKLCMQPGRACGRRT